MRRFLALVLLALLPLQFCWAAVASYCEHETQAGAGHLGHHDHQHHADAGDDAEPAADLDASPQASPDFRGDKAPGGADPDCGHCHGCCCVMLTLPSGPPAALATTRVSVTLDETGGAQAPTRPERPQWLPLA